VVGPRLALLQPSREEQLDALVGIADRGVDDAEVPPFRPFAESSRRISCGPATGPETPGAVTTCRQAQYP
jgi:hypothetical protein